MIPRNWWNVISIADEKERGQAITLFLKDIYNILNRGVLFKDNVKGALLEVTFGAADTEVEVRHGLDFVPNNYLLVGSTAALSLYDGVTENDKTFCYIRSNATGTARVFFF